MFCFIFRTTDVLWNLQNKEPREWLNLFAFTWFRFVEVLFHAYILLLLGKENLSLCRGLRYIEVHWIYVPLYYHRIGNCSLKFVEKTNYKAAIFEFLCSYRKQRGLKCKRSSVATDICCFLSTLVSAVVLSSIWLLSCSPFTPNTGVQMSFCKILRNICGAVSLAK